MFAEVMPHAKMPPMPSAIVLAHGALTFLPRIYALRDLVRK